MTQAQDLYRVALQDKDLKPVIAIGSAGTGKTYGAVEAAVEWMHTKNHRCIVARPNVSFAQSLGFLPGDAEEKLMPWVRPIRDIFYNITDKGKVESWEHRGTLQYMALEHIQGLTFDNSLIIIDECQNMTFDQLYVTLTRIGKWSRLVLCGDIRQISPKFNNSGLAELIAMIDFTGLAAHVIEFNSDDIVRSEQCKSIIKAFESWEDRIVQ